MKKKYIAASAFSLLLAVALQAQTVNIKPQVPKDKKLEEVTNVKVVSTMEAMGQSFETDVKSNNTATVVVKDKKPEGTTFTYAITKMKIDVSAMGQSMSADSEKSGDMDSPMGQGLKQVLNKNMDIEVDNNGVIKNVGGMEPGIKEVMQQTGGMANGLSAGTAFSPVFSTRGKTLKVGDTHTEVVSTENIKSETVYTLVSVNGKTAVFSFKGTSTVTGITEQSGMEMNTYVKGNVSGTVEVDTETGVALKRTMEMTGDGAMNMMGQDIPMKMKTSSVTTVSMK
jgi:hypothetical protein